MADHKPTTLAPRPDLRSDEEEDDLLILGKRDDGRPTSADEFASASFDEPWIYERTDGRLVVMSPEGTGHVRSTLPLQYRLGAYALDHPDTIQAVIGQAWIRLDSGNDRIADLGIYLGRADQDLAIPRQIPDLVFEIVSSSKRDRTRDYVTKRAEDERIGVREYVIVNRFDRTMTVLTLVDGIFREAILTINDSYTSPLLPGFTVRLAEVFDR